MLIVCLEQLGRMPIENEDGQARSGRDERLSARNQWHNTTQDADGCTMELVERADGPGDGDGLYHIS